jgi:hypothetical protein
MTARTFPELNPDAIVGTRDTLHSYSLVLGDYLAACRPKRKHWWHTSLRPSLEGLTTGVIHAQIDFELELNLRRSLLRARTWTGAELTEKLTGQSATELVLNIHDFLSTNGLNHSPVPGNVSRGETPAAEYSIEIANTLAIAWNAISASLAEFRAGIREETSPVQLWPHHFDLAMMWLPGEKVPGQNPEDEENADKQMNFGFTLGDAGIPEPYFYVTAYPLPEAFPNVKLPAGTTWHTQGFSGAVLPYRSLVQTTDPSAYLQDLWNGLLSAGRNHLLATDQ